MTNTTEPSKPEPTPSRRLLTGEEVASLLRTNRQTLRYWRYVGYGPASVKIGRHVLYAEADVQAWLEGLEGDQRPASKRGGEHG